MEETGRKRPPSFASIYTYRRSSSIPFCRITGKSHSMDEHHYVFSSEEFVKFENVGSGCRITEKHNHFKDYKYAYPVLDLDGVTRMVTEHDFHCRITAKYKAMAGYKYIYPLLGCTTDKTAEDMVSIVKAETMNEVFLPTEVETIVRGGIKDVLKAKDSEHLYIQSKGGSFFPAALKEVFKRKETPGSNRVRTRRHTMPVSLEAAAIVKEVCSPVIKLLKDIQKEVRKETVVAGQSVEIVFDLLPEEVEILKDIRKTRPKRPGRSKNRDSERKKPKHEFNESEEFEIAESPVQPQVAEEIEMVNEAPKRLSRLERYKLQFSSFEEKSNNTTGNRLTLVGAFDKDEVEELDFSDPAEIKYTESFASIAQQSVTTTKTLHEKHYSTSTEESIRDKDAGDESKPITTGTEEEDVQQKSFKELKSIIGSKLNLEKGLKFQSFNSGAQSLHGKRDDEEDESDSCKMEIVSVHTAEKEHSSHEFKNQMESKVNSSTKSRDTAENSVKLNGVIGDPISESGKKVQSSDFPKESENQGNFVEEIAEMNHREIFSSWKSVDNLKSLVDAMECDEISSAGKEITEIVVPGDESKSALSRDSQFTKEQTNRHNTTVRSNASQNGIETPNTYNLAQHITENPSVLKDADCNDNFSNLTNKNNKCLTANSDTNSKVSSSPLESGYNKNIATRDRTSVDSKQGDEDMLRYTEINNGKPKTRHNVDRKESTTDGVSFDKNNKSDNISKISILNETSVDTINSIGKEAAILEKNEMSKIARCDYSMTNGDGHIQSSFHKDERIANSQDMSGKETFDYKHDIGYNPSEDSNKTEQNSQTVSSNYYSETKLSDYLEINNSEMLRDGSIVESKGSSEALHFLYPSEFEPMDTLSSGLENMEIRLPVTCRLLKREKLFPSECEQSDICSRSFGADTTMFHGEETKRDAKWNKPCLQVGLLYNKRNRYRHLYAGGASVKSSAATAFSLPITDESRISLKPLSGTGDGDDVVAKEFS